MEVTSQGCYKHQYDWQLNSHHLTCDCAIGYSTGVNASAVGAHNKSQEHWWTTTQYCLLRPTIPYKMQQWHLTLCFKPSKRQFSGGFWLNRFSQSMHSGAVCMPCEVWSSAGEEHGHIFVMYMVKYKPNIYPNVCQPLVTTNTKNHAIISLAAGTFKKPLSDSYKSFLLSSAI